MSGYYSSARAKDGDAITIGFPLYLVQRDGISNPLNIQSSLEVTDRPNRGWPNSRIEGRGLGAES
jgi:hypothetical protein